MKDAVLAGEVSTLGDLTDEDDATVRLLGPVRKDLGTTERGHGVGVVAVLAVVQGLKRVLEDEDLLAGVGLAKAVGVSDEVGHFCVLTDDESVAETESVDNHFDLVKRFLAGVVEADVTSSRDGIGQLKEEGGLASTRRAGEHHDRGGNKALTTEGVIEPGDANLLAVAELLRYSNFVDVGAVLETFDPDVEVHLRHVLESLAGG